MADIKACLIDLDGVIYNDTRLIPGAAEIVQRLQRRRIPFRFVTNTTMKSRATLKKKLSGFGIDVDEFHIFSAAYAAAEYIRRSAKLRCHLLLTEDARQDYAGIELESESPDWVVVGDLGPAIRFDHLNTAFQKLHAGAEMIALQKNRYWLSDAGYTLDAGAFVALLEYAADKTATLIGKPSKEFFHTALDDLGYSADQVIMIGDDLVSDIAGGQAVGLRSVLVRTGKYNERELQSAKIEPWKIMDSIADLFDLPGFPK